MDNKAQITGTGAIIGVVGALVVLIVYFSIIPLLGDRIDQAADITQDDYAPGRSPSAATLRMLKLWSSAA